MKTKAQVRSNRSENGSQQQPLTAPAVRKSPDASDAKVQGNREYFRKRVDSMTNDQLIEFMRQPLYHPNAGIYLRALINSCYDPDFGVRPDDLLRSLSELREPDKRKPLQKALCDLDNAKHSIESCVAQVEALGLSTSALIGDLSQGKIEMVRLEKIQSGLRDAWQHVVDYLDLTGLGSVESAIKHLTT